MRTTITIADHLLIEAKQLAAARRMSLAKLMEDCLRKFLAEERARAELDRESAGHLPVVDAGAPVPGVDLDDTSALWEL